MPIQPTGDRVLLRRLENEQFSPGGLAIPESAQGKSRRCEVVAVGPGAVHKTTGERVPIEVAPGDVVFLGKYSGVEYEQDGEVLIFVREDEVLGKEARG